MANQDEKKSSLLAYVGNFITKHDNQLQDEGSLQTPTFDKSSVVIKTTERDIQHSNLDNRTSESTDIDYDELSLTSDPLVEIREGDEQTYKQSVYVRQYQPPTPEPIEIQVQEIFLKPRIQRPPIHVHIKPSKNRDEQRTPSPIVIQSVPPEPLTSLSNEPIFYNKYIPLDQKPLPRQIVIHRYPELPPKPRPIVVEQWLPNKPPPRRITYRHINRDELLQKESKRQRNRYIEYKKPHTTIEVEIIRLPIMKIDPKDYLTSSTTELKQLRSADLHWRI